MYVAVIGSTGKKLQPTSSYRARKLLNSKRAKIYSYRPIFTIQLLDREDGTTQPIELKMDTGYTVAGINNKGKTVTLKEIKKKCHPTRKFN